MCPIFTTSIYLLKTQQYPSKFNATTFLGISGNFGFWINKFKSDRPMLFRLFFPDCALAWSKVTNGVGA
jgi:hypothetical protein